MQRLLCVGFGRALLALALVAFGLALAPSASAGSAAQNYLVLYRGSSVPADAGSTVAKAGGRLIYSYDQIGVAVARSSSSAFAANLSRDNRVEGVSATGSFATQLTDDAGASDDASGPPPGDLPNSPATDTDHLSSLQWDMRQIKAPDAHAITGGSPSVLVGDIDTGLDYTHPDLAANVDFANSVSCESGVPNPSPAAWDDHNGHGTHTAGTIAAASNGIGIVGVAPNVKIAAIKAGNDLGYFFPEAVVCAFYWAGTHGVDVTNNSYFADPWLFNCRNDADQRAIWKAEQRAIRFAQSQGVLVVSAAGNENLDLSKQNTDTISPDFPPGSEETRDVTNACVVIPAEIPGVVTVSADANRMQKSFYSTYGEGVVDVTAPGGDSLFQITAESPNGRVLSTYPASVPSNPARTVFDCSVSPCAKYVYLQGTSMASPHVAGVAALIASQFGHMSQGRLAAMVNQTADPLSCPPNPFDPGGTGDFIAHCTGGDGYNSFYGHGQVNALSAVSHNP